MGKWILLLWLGLASLLLFGMMGADKKKAKRGQWRIPEKTLFLVAICGGAVGGTLGMYQFHHKTKHRSFQRGCPFLAVLRLLLLGYLWMNEPKNQDVPCILYNSWGTGLYRMHYFYDRMRKTSVQVSGNVL